MAYLSSVAASARGPVSLRASLFALPSLGQMMALARQRRALADLPAERLDDIGLTASQARAEARRPFWDAPRVWRC